MFERKFSLKRVSWRNIPWHDESGDDDHFSTIHSLEFYVSTVFICDLQPEKMPLYPQSILKKPSEFPPVPFDLEIDSHEDILEDDNDSLDVILPNRDLNDFSEFDRPVAKPGMF